MRDVSFYVQCVEGRPMWAATKANIEASDIGTDYKRVVHIPGDEPRNTFFRIMEEMANAPTELVVRLEDDLSGVNRNIKHNVLTWEALDDPRFGLGWLFAPGGISPKMAGKERWHNKRLHCSLGVVFWRKDIPEILRRSREWFDTNEEEHALPQDLAMTQAVVDMGKQIAIHGPCMLGHDISLSTIGNDHSEHDTDRGTFNLKWRRKAG